LVVGEAALGRTQVAVEQIQSGVQDAISGGYAAHELEGTLMLAKLQSAPEKRRRLSAEVYRKAVSKGLLRIATEAGSVGSETLRAPWRTARQ